MGSIYLVQDGGELAEMKEQAYNTEDLLQELLAKYPNLLAGDQMDPEKPRRWLLISREAGVPGEEGGSGRWSVDHLFLDQDGIPTLVEVKRSSDTRIRREVVGQMLDYAANAVVYWPVEEMRAKFEASLEAQGLEAQEALAESLGEELDEETFWEAVKTNLRAGKVRLLFVADEIPTELQRIVEFLNGQMDPAEVLAVEIKQFVGKGERPKTLVPKVVGQTAETRRGPRESRQWTKKLLFEELEAKHPQAVGPAKAIHEWASQKGLIVERGTGSVEGARTLKLLHNDLYYSLVRITTKGTVETRLAYLRRRAPFDNDQLMGELVRRFTGIPGFDLGPNAESQPKPVRLEVLAQQEPQQQFLQVLDWVVDKIKET